jgi:Skp family chaperone for outer membrane proteins
MFTKNVRIALLGTAFLILAGAAMAQEAAIRIAVVDLDRLVGQSVAGRQLQNRLAEFEQQVQTQGQALAEKARSTRQLMADGANSLSEDRLTELQKQLEDETIAVRRFTDDKQREGQKMQQEGLREIEQKLQPVLERIQGEQSYDLILNKALGFVVMASDRVDITERMIELFDAAEAAAAGSG